jgi:tryptophan synthase alpha chain
MSRPAGAGAIGRSTDPHPSAKAGPSAAAGPGRLEAHLRARRDAGAALLVPYLTAGISDDWLDQARAYAEAGADAIEIGLPFSDPMLDGPAIQLASQLALDRGMTPLTAVDQLAGIDLGVPLIAMTYTNVLVRPGRQEFCRRLADAGVAGLIVVDTPHDEAETLSQAAGQHGIELVMMVAPSSGPDRIRQIAGLSQGFVYAASVMGPTGERAGIDRMASQIVSQVRAFTSTPVLLGFGIATAAAAAEAAAHADGIVVGSALIRRILDGAGPKQLGAEVRAIRDALDAGGSPRTGHPGAALDPVP